MAINLARQKMVEVSCIIINFNTSGYTIDCVQSIINTHKNDFSYEIIVVDNASEKEDFMALQTGISSLHSEKIQLIRSKINLGFGGGNMLGVQHCSNCNYYAFINNDTLQIDENCLLQLQNFMNENKEIAVVSPQMLDEKKNFRMTLDHFSSLQREILKRAVLEFLFPRRYLNRKKFYDEPTKVDYIQGSFMFIRATDFNDVGGFDTNLFLYYEESDLCRRLLKEKNKATYLYPQLQYIHYKGVSTAKNVKMKIELKLSLLYTIRKHYGFWAYKILLTYFQIRYFFSSIVKPKYFALFKVLIRGAHLSESIKQQQKIKILAE
ncbi:MAG: glycosyltransferase family 2 protein [Gillisia sp.]